MEELRKAVAAIRVTSTAPVPVRVQFLGGDAPVYPEFCVQPGCNHVIIRPAEFDSVYYEASRRRPGRFMSLEFGFWLDGAFHLMPATLPEMAEAAS